MTAARGLRPAGIASSHTGGPGGGRGGARRGWIVLLVLVVAAVVVVAIASRRDDRAGVPLSPSSAAPDGSRALARILDARGTEVRDTDTLAGAGAGATNRTVLVLDPLAYDDDQLRELAASTTGSVVLLAPQNQQLAALGVPARVPTPDETPDVNPTADTITVAPRCDVPAATAAGAVAFDAFVPPYRSTGDDVASCYDGRLLQHDRVVVIADSSTLTNERLADTGVAALGLNVLGATDELVWLRPGADGDGPTGSLWDALPPHSELAAIWLLIVGLLLVLWRGRRLGAPVREPLPVTVRAAEVLYGRGRLYARHHDLPAASVALREATLRRLRTRLALPAATPPAEVAHVLARRLRIEVPAGLLDGPPPTDDNGLVMLAAALRDLEEQTAASASGGRSSRPEAG